MPIYEVSCPRDGVQEIISSDYRKQFPCPECGIISKTLISSPARPRFVQVEQLPLGNKSRGRFIPPEGKRVGILVPSFGALDKEEVDYIAEAEIEKENTRIRHSEQKETLEKVTTALLRTPQGKRHEMLNQIQGGK